MAQAVQITGALLILVAYALAQAGVLAPRGMPFLVLNLAGALILAASAFEATQWGFFMLNATWSLVSVVALARRRVAPAPS